LSADDKPLFLHAIPVVDKHADKPNVKNTRTYSYKLTGGVDYSDNFRLVTTKSKIMATNPISLVIPRDVSGYITCNAHAAYFQRVTISTDAGPVAVFSGTGEGVPMKTADGKSMVPIGPLRSSYTFNMLFEFSTNGPSGPFKKGLVANPIISHEGDSTIVSITSEDGADSDNNDSYLIAFYGPM